MSDKNKHKLFLGIVTNIIYMVNTDQYSQNPIYKIIGVNVDDLSREVEFYVSIYNEAQKSIPKVIDGYTVLILKDSIG